MSGITKHGCKQTIFTLCSIHLAFLGATTGSGSVLLRVLRDTGWERENCKLEKLKGSVREKWKGV